MIPSRVLIEAGLSYRQLRLLCQRGHLIRVRQGWLATPDADAELVRAAAVGGVLTCMTQAKRLELWSTRNETQLHLGVRVGSQKPHGEDLSLHWNAPVVERDSRQLEDNLINVLATVALCQPAEEAQAVWESALNKGLVEVAELRRLPFTGRASELARNVVAHMDSGLESLVRRRLGRFRIVVCGQPWILGHYVDFLIGERLVLQIDGGTHVGKQRTSDIEHDALLMLNGYHVIRVGYDQVMNRWHEVQDLILRAVAQGLADA